MTHISLTPSDDINLALRSLKGPATVHLAAGVYRQKVEINKDDIIICGAGKDKTILENGDFARAIHTDGREYNTFRTYTVCVSGKSVKICDLTIKNTASHPETHGQCVALSVHSKNFFAQNINVSSTQDSLFLSPFPDDLVVRYRGFIPDGQLYCEGKNVHIFDSCDISGTVDFIFGGARAYFYRCKLISLKDERNIGFVAAPSHPLAEEIGFVFNECSFLGFGPNPEEVYLARPWRDFGKCVFISCSLQRHISPLLFDKWNDTERDKTARFEYFNLKGVPNMTPVPWAKEITHDMAQKYIDTFKKYI